jgi:hypothetical protein
LCFGPLVLPLIWFNPRFGKRAKIILSVAIIAFSYCLGFLFFSSVQSITRYYKAVFQGTL